MNLVKSGVRGCKGGEQSNRMAMNFVSLALEASACPLPDIGVHTRPDVPSGNKTLCYPNTWMRKRMESLENRSPKLNWDQWAVHTSGRVAQYGGIGCWQWDVFKGERGRWRRQLAELRVFALSFCHLFKIDDRCLLLMQGICSNPRQCVCCWVVDTLHVTDVGGKLRHEIQVTDLSWRMSVRVRSEGIYQGFVIGEDPELSAFDKVSKVLDGQVHSK